MAAPEVGSRLAFGGSPRDRSRPLISVHSGDCVQQRCTVLPASEKEGRTERKASREIPGDALETHETVYLVSLPIRAALRFPRSCVPITPLLFSLVLPMQVLPMQNDHRSTVETETSGKIQNTAFTIIIGAKKAATTSLYRSLIQHPQVCPSVVKEPEYFTENQDHGVEKAQYPRYEDLWPQYEPQVHRCCLEASTGYTKYPMEKGVARRIKEYGISPRFIYIVRNPFDRITSHLNFDRFAFYSPVTDFTDSHLIDVSRYASQLHQFTQHFPNRSRYHVLVFRDFVDRRRETLQELCTFMGIDPTFTFPTKAKNKTPSLSVLEHNLYRIGGLRRFGKRIFPDSVRHSLLTLFRSMSTSAELEMSPVDRVQIHRALEDDMHRLRREFGVPVSDWGF